MSHDDKRNPWSFDEALARQLMLVPIPAFELRTSQRPTMPARRKRARAKTPLEVPRAPRTPDAG